MTLPGSARPHYELRKRIHAARAGDRVELGEARLVLDAPLVLERSIVLVGAPGGTVLDAEGTHPLLVTTGMGERWRFEHIAFENGAADWGGALQSPNKNTLEFEDCRFARNRSAKNGAAIYFEQATASFRRCVFAGNQAGGSGALALGRQCDVEIDRCVFVGNEADAGGALFLGDNAALVVKSSTFVANEAKRRDGGGCMFVFGTSAYGPTAHFSNCIVSGEAAFGVDPGEKKLQVFFMNSILPASVAGKPGFEDVKGNTFAAPELVRVGPDLFALAPGASGADTADVTRIERDAVDLLGCPLIRAGKADPGALARP